MNSFGLLSSSTKLRTSKQCVQQQPSAGNVHDARPSASSQTSSSPRKRKRASNSDSIAQSEIDNSDHNGRRVGRTDNLELDERNLLRSGENGLDNLVSDSNEQLDSSRDGTQLDNGVSHDHVRQFLEKNKIKITELYSPLEEPKNRDHARYSSRDTRRQDSKRRKVNHLPQPLQDFESLSKRFGVPKVIMANLVRQRFTIPTEIQSVSLPLLLGSRTSPSHHRDHQIEHATQMPSDHLACHLLSVAPTGSGKTLAYLIPLMQSVLQQRGLGGVNTQDNSKAPCQKGPAAIIIAPTKELAKQITIESRKLGFGSGVKTVLLKKGMKLPRAGTERESQRDWGEHGLNGGGLKNDLGVKADIVVSTPHGFLSAAKTSDGSLSSLSSILNLVLDEADVLLDPQFREQTMEIWSACKNQFLRVSLWSATVGSNIEEIAKSTIEDRSREPPGDQTREPVPLVRLVVGLKDSSIPNINHKLVYAASEQGKLMTIRQILGAGSGGTDTTLPKVHPPLLVFTQTIPRAIALSAELRYDIPREAGGSSRIAVLHADLSDSTRDGVMSQFRRGDIWVLITTDLLARGVDFQGINGVVSYDLPSSSASYVHRVGRTGRAGRHGGVAITLYSKDDLPFVKNVANVIAASESQRSDVSGTDREWMLKSLPKPSKRQKEILKRRGVDSRRIGKKRDADGHLYNSKTQISTKSGFQRRMDNNRKGTIERGRRQTLKDDEMEERSSSDSSDEFEGFEGFDSETRTS